MDKTGISVLGCVLFVPSIVISLVDGGDNNSNSTSFQ